MTRRDAAWAIMQTATLAGSGEFFAGWLNARQTQNTPSQSLHVHSSAPPEPDRWTSYSPKFFSEPEFRTLEAFTAILIPSDDTPGAREAHVAAFIDFVIDAAAEYAPEMQTQWRSAMSWLHLQDFARLSPEQQVDFVLRISEPERDHSKTNDGYPPYRLIKEMTVRAFYSSRAGLIDVLEYKGLAYLKEFPGCDHPEHHKV